MSTPADDKKNASFALIEFQLRAKIPGVLRKEIGHVEPKLAQRYTAHIVAVEKAMFDAVWELNIRWENRRSANVDDNDLQAALTAYGDASERILDTYGDLLLGDYRALTMLGRPSGDTVEDMAVATVDAALALAGASAGSAGPSGGSAPQRLTTRAVEKIRGAWRNRRMPHLDSIPHPIPLSCRFRNRCYKNMIIAAIANDRVHSLDRLLNMGGLEHFRKRTHNVYTSPAPINPPGSMYDLAAYDLKPGMNLLEIGYLFQAHQCLKHLWPLAGFEVMLPDERRSGADDTMDNLTRLAAICVMKDNSNGLRDIDSYIHAFENMWSHKRPNKPTLYKDPNDDRDMQDDLRSYDYLSLMTLCCRHGKPHCLQHLTSAMDPKDISAHELKREAVTALGQNHDEYQQQATRICIDIIETVIRAQGHKHGQTNKPAITSAEHAASCAQAPRKPQDDEENQNSDNTRRITLHLEEHIARHLETQSLKANLAATHAGP